MVETCWAAELSDRADRSCRPTTGSQVAGAIHGPDRSPWAAANSADARLRAASVDDAVRAVGSVVLRTVSSSARPRWSWW